MQLIKKLGTQLDKNGRKQSWAIFKCLGCLQEVEKEISGGKRDKSCGCNQNPIKHGGRKTKLYVVYFGMLQRCTYIKHKSYKDYGGKGIKVCDKWLDKESGFINFRNWSLNNGYKEGLTIDRKIDSLGYYPENCQWITNQENVRKKGSNKIKNIEMANEIRELWKTGKYLQKELAEKYEIHQTIISKITHNKIWRNS